jgi:hypothetical protein
VKAARILRVGEPPRPQNRHRSDTDLPLISERIFCLQPHAQSAGTFMGLRYNTLRFEMLEKRK